MTGNVFTSIEAQGVAVPEETLVQFTELGKGDVPGHPFHGNQYTEFPYALPMGERISRLGVLPDDDEGHSYWMLPDGSAMEVETHRESLPEEATRQLGRKYQLASKDTRTNLYGRDMGFVRIYAAVGDMGINTYGELTDRQVAALHLLRMRNPLWTMRFTTPLESGTSVGEGWDAFFAQHARDKAAVSKGDLPGHPFHGNQYTDGSWSASDSPDAPWRATKKEWIRHVVGPEPTGEYEENQEAWSNYFEAERPARKEWERQTLAAVSEGKLSPEQAEKNGLFTSDGYPWKPLPETLYHVTTNAGAIEREGLKSRAAQGGGSGKGLGGGDSDSISMTASREIADSILNGFVEGKQVLDGKLTVADMIEASKRGTGAQRPWFDDLMRYHGGMKEDGKYPAGFDAFLRGKDLSSGMFGPPDDKHEWTPSPHAQSWTDGNGKLHYNLWERDLTEDEKLDRTFDFFKRWLAFRGNAGGPIDPVFFGSDINHLKNTDPSNIKILEFKPAKGAKGKYLVGEDEYRIFSNKAVKLVGDATHSGKVAKGDVEGHPFHGNQYTGSTDYSIPKKLYHSSSADFDQFNLSDFGRSGFRGLSGIQGVFLTTRNAPSYGPNVYEVEPDISRPLHVTAKEGAEYGLGGVYRVAREKFDPAKHDSIAIHWGDGSTEWIVPDPSKLRITGKTRPDVKKREKPRCPHCGARNYGLLPPDFETARCGTCGRTWDHGIVPGINDPDDIEKGDYAGHQFHGNQYTSGAGVVSDLPETLYHVTLTSSVPSIQRKGLERFHPSNWVKAGNEERYGQSEIYTFEHKDDAVRWAARWDWDLHHKTGTGKISIIEVKSAGSDWEQDTADPLSQAGSKGRWLKTRSAVAPDRIGAATPVTTDMVRTLVQKGDVEGHPFHGNQYTDVAGSGVEEARVRAPKRTLTGPINITAPSNDKVRRVADRVAKQMGFPVGRIKVETGDPPTAEQVFLGGLIVGQFNANTNRIVLFSSHMISIGTPDKLQEELMIGGTLAHEIEHYRVHAALRTKDWDDYVTKHGEALAREDGVSDYSRRWWDEYGRDDSQFFSACNETLAEIARIRWETHASGGSEDFGYIPKVWSGLYDLVEKEHGTAKKADRPEMVRKEYTVYFRGNFEPCDPEDAEFSKTVYRDGSVEFRTSPTATDVAKGDYAGHPFRGNQYTDAQGTVCD